MYESVISSQIYQDEIKRVERNAELAWRFRHLKSAESKILTAILTTVLGLFLR